MNEMRLSIKKIISILLLFTFSKLFAFEEKNILSPISGVWKNKQALVLNLEKGTDVYYSFTGSDPYVSGFSYDSPVLIDQTGDITVKITSIAQSGERKDFTIEYNVEENSGVEYSIQSKEFINSINQNPIVPYISGTDFFIPSEFLYSLENSKTPYLKSKLSLSSKNSVERFVPCFAVDFTGNNFFHFIIQVLPAEKTSDAKVDNVPFEISEWNNFSFKDKNFIYRIDDENWKSPSESSFIDRNYAHKISWQPVEFYPENKIFEYELPAKPSVLSRKNKNGVVEFFIDGNENFTFEKNSSFAYADAFENEDVKSSACFKIFYNGNYQGTIEADFSIDRLPPEPPEIFSSSVGKLTRKKSFFRISSEPGAKIFYALSKPFEIPDGFVESVQAEFENIKPENFSLYNGNEIFLKSSDKNAVFYKVCAYSVDASGNKSEISEQKIIIDETNYYLFANSQNEIQDGSYDNPFKSFEQLISVLKSSNKKLRFHIYGNIEIPDNEFLISKDCTFIGHDSSLSFKENSVIKISNANVEFENLIIEKKSQAENSPLVFAKNSYVGISNCEFSAVFLKKGSLLDLENSKAQIENSGFTVQADSYVCGISSENSNVNCKNSRFTSVAESCFNVKVSGGTCSFSDSSFSLIGTLGRGIQILNANASVIQNEFNARLSDSTKKSSPIWSNVNSVVSEKNIQKGF